MYIRRDLEQELEARPDYALDVSPKAQLPFDGADHVPQLHALERTCIYCLEPTSRHRFRPELGAKPRKFIQIPIESFDFTVPR